MAARRILDFIRPMYPWFGINMFHEQNQTWQIRVDVNNRNDLMARTWLTDELLDGHMDPPNAVREAVETLVAQLGPVVEQDPIGPARWRWIHPDRQQQELRRAMAEAMTREMDREILRVMDPGDSTPGGPKTKDGWQLAPGWSANARR